MSFLADGYEVIGLSTRIAHEGRAMLQEMLGPLEDYRGDDINVHAAAAKAVSGIPRRIIQAEMPYFRELIGSDLHIQQQPFLRIARPGAPQDNIGMHRDTWYGDTPYEISVWIPFTDTDEGNALRVAPGSHVWPEEKYPVERFAGGVEKGSLRHSLGFIHGSPKRFAHHVPTVGLPVQVGQAIVFSLALLHGQEVNSSTQTRISMDVRLANSLAPVKMARSRNDSYYERLAVSPVTQTALAYAEANKC